MTAQTTDQAARVVEQPRKPFPWGKVVSYGILVAFSLLYIGPLFMLINASFKPLADFFKDPTGLAASVNFDNYTKAWELANFPRYLLNSAFYTAVATTVFVLTSVFVAFPIARGIVKGSGALLTLYVVAWFLPAALIPQFQLILNIGLYNTRTGYILLFLVNAIGMIILVNYIKSIPRELDESAAVDGCGYFRFVWSIVLPLIRPAVATVTVLHAIFIWNELLVGSYLIQSQGLKTIPLAAGGLISAQRPIDWNVAATVGVVTIIPIFIFSLFAQRYIARGITAGAVK